MSERNPPSATTKGTKTLRARKPKVEDVPATKRPSTSTPKNNKTHVVVIGARIIGLCIARQLALDAIREKKPIQIDVIEIASSTKHASAHCAGIFDKKQCPPDMQRYLRNGAWPKLLRKSRTRLGQSTKVLQPAVNSSPSTASVESPTWYQNDLELVRDEGSVNKINTQRLIEMLYEVCHRVKVKVHFDSEVTAVRKQEHRVTAVAINHKDSEQPEWQPCDNLIVAAGPWTPGICSELFPDSTLHLDNEVFNANWTIHSGIEARDGEDVGLIADEYAYMTDMRAVSQNDGSVLVAGVYPVPVRAPSKAEAEGDVVPDRSQALTTWSHAYLSSREETGLNMLDRGTEYICYAGAERKAFVGPVSMAELDQTYGGKEAQPGVWLCYGFGMFGTFLAPEAAVELCRMIDDAK